MKNKICLICGDKIRSCRCDGAQCNLCGQIYQGLSLDCLCTGAEYPLCPHSEGWSQHPEELLEACNLCGFVQ